LQHKPAGLAGVRLDHRAGLAVVAVPVGPHGGGPLAALGRRAVGSRVGAVEADHLVEALPGGLVVGVVVQLVRVDLAALGQAGIGAEQGLDAAWQVKAVGRGVGLALRRGVVNVPGQQLDEADASRAVLASRGL